MQRAALSASGIDDGSAGNCAPIFDRWRPRRAAPHPSRVNLGKAGPLETGFIRCCSSGRLVPASSPPTLNGQHRPDAVLRVARAMKRHPDAIVLGARQFFKCKNIPLPNLMGNTITRVAIWLLTGLFYGDTQCGLRGFSRDAMVKLIGVPGERFEFENIMLLRMRGLSLPIVEVPMEAVYIGENESSHFKPGLDSVRIYNQLIRFALGPIAAGLLSFWLYWGLRNPLPQIHGALAAALSTLAGWVALALALPRAARGWALLGGLSVAALHGGVYWLLAALAGLSLTGAWWLAALPAAVAGYMLWLRLYCGKRPRLIFEDDGE